MNAPHAIQAVGFSFSEQQTLAQLEQAKQIIEQARETNPLVRNIMATCEENGLVPIDQMRMLCANLIYQHDQATVALTNMDNKIKAMEEHIAMTNRATFAREVYGPRKVLETWRSTADVLYCRCDDGTVWKFMKGEAGPYWAEERSMSAPIPQGGGR